VKRGETVLVLGATGAAGQVAVQAAALLGAGRVIAAGRHLPTLRTLLNRGADRIVALDGSTQDADALLDATGGGADVVFDPVWGPAFVSALRATRPGGRTVTIGRSGSALTADIPIFSLLGKSMLTYRNRDTPPEVIRAAFDRMLRHIARGELIVDTKQFRLGQAEQAWKLQQDAPHAKLSLLP
jgi:NADPH2:quinone reductase